MNPTIQHALTKSVIKFEPLRLIHLVAKKYLTKKCLKMLHYNKEILHLTGSINLINTKLNQTIRHAKSKSVLKCQTSAINTC